MSVTALAPWYGSNRLLGAEVGKLLAGRAWVGVPFAGGCAEVFRLTARTILVNDLHHQLINLARCVAQEHLLRELARRLARKWFHPLELADAQSVCRQLAPKDVPDLCAAEHYFVCAWMGRSGNAGTPAEFTGGLALRYNAGGGDSAVRYYSAVKALWHFHKTLKRCTFSTDDVFDFLGKCHDSEECALYCFLPGSTVRRVDEAIVPITEVRAGDVLAPGRVVQRVFERPYSGLAFRLRVSGLPDRIAVTAEHPVLRIPGRKAGARKEKRTVQQLWAQRDVVPASALSLGDLVAIPTGGMEVPLGPVEMNYRQPKGSQPRHITITPGPEFFRFLGYYAAEGHLVGRQGKNRTTVVLSFGIHETDTLVADAADCALKATGLVAVIAPRAPHPTVTSVRIGSTSFARTIGTLVPGTAATKRLAPMLMTASIELQRQLLIGWLRGDGGIWHATRGRTKLTGTSRSEVLARQMHQIAIRCGLRPNFKRRAGSFDVYFASEDAELLGWPTEAKIFRSVRRLVNGHILARITAIEQFHHSGVVHNIEVDDDHLFCAPFALVHNCDPPFPGAGLKYTHNPGPGEAERVWHARLAQAVGAFVKTKVVMRFYDVPLVRELYPEDRWEWRFLKGRTQSNGAAPEVLLVNRSAAGGA